MEPDGKRSISERHYRFAAAGKYTINPLLPTMNPLTPIKATSVNTCETPQNRRTNSDPQHLDSHGFKRSNHFIRGPGICN